MKLFLTVLALLLFVPITIAENADVKTRVALALAQANKAGHATCTCGTNCTCTIGECGDSNCPSLKVKSPGLLELAAYAVQYAKAVRENRPLLIWVGETCPSYESQWTDYIHAHLSEYDSPTGVVEKGPGVIVGKPDGLGGLDRLGTLRGIPDKSQIETLLGVRIGGIRAQPGELSLPTFRPTFGGGIVGGRFGGGGSGC